MTFQHIKQTHKNEFCSIDVFSFNGVEITTPCCFLGIRSSYHSGITIDMNVAIRLMNKTSHSESIQGLYFPLEKYPQIKKKMNPNQRAFVNLSKFNRRILLLPSTEAMYYEFDKGTEKSLMKDPAIKKYYSEIIDFYNLYRNSLGYTKASHKSFNNFIKTLDTNLRDYVYTFLRYQHQANSLFLIPPTPPIFNLDLGLDYSEKCYQYGKEFLSITNLSQERSENQLQPLALFLPVSINCFQNIRSLRLTLTKLKRLLNNNSPNIICIKIFDESKQPTKLDSCLIGFRYFFDVINKYCKDNNRLSLILDTDEIGNILLYRGLNITGKPIGRKSFVGKKGGQIDGPPPREVWPMLDPETRDKVTFGNFRKRHSTFQRNANQDDFNINALPYLSDLEDLYNTLSIENISRDEQIELTKLTPLILVSSDLAELKDSIIDGTTRHIIGRYSRQPSNYAVKIRKLLNE